MVQVTWASPPSPDTTVHVTGVSAMHVNSRPRTVAMPGTEASLQPDHGGNDHRSRCCGKPRRAPLCPGHRRGHSPRPSPLPPTVGHAAAAGSHRHMEEGGPVVHRPRRTHDVGLRRHSWPNRRCSSSVHRGRGEQIRSLRRQIRSPTGQIQPEGARARAPIALTGLGQHNPMPIARTQCW